MKFDLYSAKQSQYYEKIREMANLLVECRDALPAISVTAARLHNVDLGLADRIEACLEPWEVKDAHPPSQQGER